VDVLGRIGGEEFLIIAPETDAHGAMILGERVRQTVEKNPFSYKEHTIYVTVSLGFAVAEATVIAEYEQLKQLASAALAEAKMTGRNRCIVYPFGSMSVDQAV
jgi:diguanylate cyclase (GGDEF)-like protein